MATEESGIGAMLCKWLAKETRGLFGGLAGGLIGGIAAFATINHMSAITLIGTADPVSIANTYIVYATLVIAGIAVFLTVAGLIFTQHFAMEKESHLAHAFTSLVNDLCTKEGKAVELIKEVMKRPDVVQHMDDSVKAKLAEVVASNVANAREKTKQAQGEQEFLESLADDLEQGNGKGGGK